MIMQNLSKQTKKQLNNLYQQKKKLKKKKLSDDPRVEQARTEVQNAFKNYNKSTSAAEQPVLQDKRNHLNKVYNDLQEEELESMIRETEEADIRKQHRESWKLINNITGRKAAKKGIIKGNCREERLNNWHKHFSNLLGQESNTVEDNVEITNIFENLEIDDNEFTMEEVEIAKRKLQEGKQCGSDRIAPEVLKRCNLDDIILKYANKLLIEKVKPKQWSEIDMVPLPKSGDLSDTNNCRGISLSSIVAKFVNKMILNRIQTKMDKHLRPNQNGFRPGRSTNAHILALRRFIEGVRSHNRKAIILYIDFKKAFDSINRRVMMRILKAYDVPQKLLNAIDLLYQNTKARVITPEGETEYFKINAGVLQGDTLAPYFFAIVLDYVMRKTFNNMEEELGFTLHRRRSRRSPAVMLTDLDFADDLAIFTEEFVQAQEVLKRLENNAEEVGLVCNSKKTVIQTFNQENVLDVVAKNGDYLKNVKNFK